MDEFVTCIEPRTQDRAPVEQLGDREVVEIVEILLRFDDRVEIAAIGDVDCEIAQVGTFDRQILGIEEGRNIGDPDLFNICAFLAVLGLDHAGRCIQHQRSRRPGSHQPVLERHGHRSDGSVAAHRQAARGLDEQDRDVAIVARRWIQDRTRHHVVAARLEHQPGADPVILGEEMRPALHHRRALEQRAAAGDKADGIAAGMSVDAEEGVTRHGSEPCRCERLNIDRRRPVGNEVGDDAPGRRRLRQAEMTVAEGVDDVTMRRCA